MDTSIHKSYLGTAYAIKAFVDPRATQGSSLGSALYGVSGMLPRFWSRTPEGYSGPGTIAPMLAGDSSDDENYSDSGDEGTHWEHPPVSVVVGSEAGIDLSSPPSSASYIPLTGGPFSALIQSMWPQDILAKIQQTEDSGVHPLCEYDEFGFKIDPEEHGNKNDSDISSFATVEDPSLRLKWTAYIESLQHHGVGDLTWNQVDAQLEKTGKLRDLVYAGIPHSMRVYLWPRLSGGLMKKSGSEISYKRIVKKSDSQDDSLIASQIEKDLCRTMPSNACYTLNDSIGIPKLKRILRAIAWLYPDIGYCQGMGMIVGSLLLFVDEENAFWIMVAMIEDLLPSSYFSHTLLGVQVDQRVLRQLIANYLPTLDEAMKDHDIELSLITLHWFLTAMASVLPLKVLLRVWDIFFFEGSIVLFKLTLGMLKMKEKVISRMENSAQIFNLLSDLPGEITDVEELLQHANKASASLTPVIINAHREKHFAFLLATEASLQGEKKSVQNNNNYENRFASLEIVRRTRLPVRKSWSHLFFDLGYSILEAPFCGLVSGRRSALAVKAKNVRQTEIISDLRESVVQIARHFNFTGTKADLLPDYSIDSHVKDYENYVNVARSKHRRAKALIDFERHEDDELGFRKNDLITIISQKDEHCWIGELNGLRGWFPAKFVELLDERSKEYSAAGDDTVTEAITDLVRGRLCRSVEAIFEHGLKQGMGVACHPWLFIQEASKNEVKKDFKSVYSRLVLCKTYKLDDDGKVLSPEELLYRAVQEIDATHDAVKANMDVKMRSLIAYGLNEQALHLWFEALCSSEEATRKWYHAHSFIRSPGWIQIKCELRALAQFSFNLSINTEISDVQATASNMKEDVQDMLVKHHLFSWDL